MCDSYSALLGWLSHARCPPPWPFSPGPGDHLPTRGASLLGPTPAASQSKLLSYSPLLPPTRGGARTAPSAPSCPFSPGASRGSRHPARARRRPSWPYITLPMPEGRRAEYGFDSAPPFFYPSSEGGPFAYSAYSRSASRCRVGLAAARGDPIGPGCVIWQFQRCSRAVPTLKIRSAA